MPHADSIIQAHDSAIVAMQSTKDESLVRVRICLENSETRMPEILSGFARAHRYVTVDIEAGDAQDLALMMAAKELDIAILTSAGDAQLQKEDSLLEQSLVEAMQKIAKPLMCYLCAQHSPALVAHGILPRFKLLGFCTRSLIFPMFQNHNWQLFEQI